MSFQGINFSSQHIVPSDDGRLYEAIFEDGALHGCELSYVGAALTIGAGYLMIGGREIEITEDEVFNINEATSGYAQLVLTIDLTQTATIGAFNQVSIDVRYASTEAGFASMVQDDINGAGTKYQQQLALVSLGTGGITGIVAGMPSASLKGSGRVFSIISVTYPEGSICTCSDGTTMLTARDTSGKALFNVTVGEWTVRWTDGSQTYSKTVSITEAGQVVSVNMNEIWLYNSGVDNEAITGGWYATNENSNLVFNTVALSAGGKTFTTNKKAINISGFQKVELYVSDKDEAISTWTLGVFSSHGYNESMDPVAQYSDPSMTGLCSIDVSGLSGDYYIGAGITRNVTAGTGAHWMKISYIRLVR